MLVTAPWKRPDWEVMPETFKGTIFLLALVTCASLMPVEKLPAASWQTALGLGFVSAVFDNIPLTALALKQGGYDWGFLAYAVGFGGSMIWFGSSAGVALANMYPEAKSVGLWLRHGWHVAIAYVIGFFFMLAMIGWHPDAPPLKPSLRFVRLGSPSVRARSCEHGCSHDFDRPAGPDHEKSPMVERTGRPAARCRDAGWGPAHPGVRPPRVLGRLQQPRAAGSPRGGARARPRCSASASPSSSCAGCTRSGAISATACKPRRRWASTERSPCRTRSRPFPTAAPSGRPSRRRSRARGRRPSLSICSTSTASSASTTSMATPSAMRCCARWRSGSGALRARATWWRGSAATSSRRLPSVSETAKRPPRSASGSLPRSAPRSACAPARSPVGVAVGVALYPQDGATAEEIMHHADLAMYGAKASNRSTLQFFPPPVRDAVA